MYCTSTVRRPPARRHASRRGLYLHSLLLALFALTFAPAPAGAQAQWSAEFTLLPDDGLQAILRRCGADGGECEVLAEGVVATGLSGSSYSLGSYAWQDGTVLTTEPLPAPPVAMNASSFREQYSESNIALGVEALASGAGVSAVGRGAYVVSIAPLNQPSQQLYAALNYAGTSWALICPVELLASPGRLVCWTESSMGAAFSAERKTVSLAATVTAEDETALLSILLQRMHQRAIARRGVEAVADGNAARTANSRGIVGGTWFLLMLIVLCLVLAVSTVLTWMAPLLPNQLLLISAWFYVLMALSMGLGWGAGFVGWMAVLSGAAVILLIGGIALAVSRARRRRKVAALGDEEVSPMTLQQVGDTSSSRSSGSNRVGKQKLSDGDDDAPYPLSPVAGRMPEPLSKLQRRLLWICLLLTGLVAVIIVVMVLGWNMSMYSVWDRTTHAPAEEFQPQMVGKALALAYSFDGLAARLRLNWLLGTYSVSCGAKYSAELTEAQKLADIKQDFIDKYSINMTMFSPSDYRQYSSVNEWFYRGLAPGVRPITEPQDDSVIVSPADARVVVYQRVPEDLAIWLKGEPFTVERLLAGDPAYEALAGGSVAIIRLAPQDYHRFHTHIAGTVLRQTEVEGPLYSVFADAIRAENGAIFNQRTVTVLEHNWTLKPTAFVAIGATCVGSVVMSVGPGQEVAKGQQAGYFEFGGSTIVVVFPPDSVAFDSDLVERSDEAVETYLTMGSQLGRWL